MISRRAAAARCCRGVHLSPLFNGAFVSPFRLLLPFLYRHRLFFPLPFGPFTHSRFLSSLLCFRVRPFLGTTFLLSFLPSSPLLSFLSSQSLCFLPFLIYSIMFCIFFRFLYRSLLCLSIPLSFYFQLLAHVSVWVIT